MKKVLIVGSLNMDQVIKVKNLPQVGETIYGDSLKYSCGGKGANQAVAMAKMNMQTFMLGKVGNDENGMHLIDSLKRYKVNTEHVTKTNKPTGLALIYVDYNGNNNITIIRGANHEYTVDEIKQKEKFISSFDAVVCQLEIPLAIVKKVFTIAKKHNIPTFLNPAPAIKLEKEILELSDFIIPNETEFKTIFGISKNIEELNQIEISSLIDLPKSCHLVITYGSKGVYLLKNNNFEKFNAIKVDAVDTTAAGDSFIGGFVYEYLNSSNMEKAINFGIKVASITVTRHGAQDSIPFLHEVV